MKKVIKAEKTLAELSAEFDVHQNQIIDWKNQLIDEHLKQVEQKIIELQKFQIQLQQLRQSCATQSTIDDCQILRHLEAGLTDA